MEERASYIDKEEESRKLFKLFDSGGNGFIRIDDFMSIAKKYTPYLSEESIQTIFLEADRDKDGKVSFRDFNRMLDTFESQAPALSPAIPLGMPS